MPDTLTGATEVRGADLIRAVAAESNEELAAGLEEDFRQMTAAQGRFLVRLGEVARRESFRDEGATSAETWAVERFGVAAATARAYVHVGVKAPRCPTWWGRCARALCPWTGCAPWPMWRRRRPTGNCRTRPESARSVSWPTSPARQPSGGRRILGPCPLRARPSLSALQRHLPHRDGPAARRVLRRGQGLPRGPSAPDPFRWRSLLRGPDPHGGPAAFGPAPLRRHQRPHGFLGWGRLGQLVLRGGGNANEELTFLGPTGRVMASRPSPRWTRNTAGRRSG